MLFSFISNLTGHACFYGDKTLYGQFHLAPIETDCQVLRRLAESIYTEIKISESPGILHNDEDCVNLLLSVEILNKQCEDLPCQTGEPASHSQSTPPQ